MLAELFRIAIPVLLLIAFGAGLARFRPIDVGTLSSLALHVLLPAVLVSLATTMPALTKGFASLAIAFGVHFVVMVAVSWSIGRVPRLREHMPLLVIAGGFYNLGNFGLPVLLMYGYTSFVLPASAFLSVQLLLTFVIGIPLMGRVSTLKSIHELRRYPVIWFSAIALVIYVFELELPSTLLTVSSQLAAALPAVALATIGVQLARITAKQVNWLFLGVGVVIRNAVSPLVAWVVAAHFGLSGEHAVVLIVLSAMPVAANMQVLSIQFNRAPEDASALVVISTLIGIVSIPLLLAALA